jgi:hypothetical protein
VRGARWAANFKIRTSQPALDGDFPQAGGAAIQQVVGVFQQSSRLGTELAALRNGPQQDMRIQQDAH